MLIINRNQHWGITLKGRAVKVLGYQKLCGRPMQKEKAAITHSRKQDSLLKITN